MATPIWRDLYVTMQSTTSATFRILAESVEIYRGKAYQKPGEDAIKIRINDVCADFIANKLPIMLTEKSDSFYFTFEIEEYIDDAWVETSALQLYNDWSYDYNYNPATMGLSFPITGKADPRQMIFYSSVETDSVRVRITHTNGESEILTCPVVRSADFNIDFNDDFAKMGASNPTKTGTVLIDLSRFSDVASVTIAGVVTYSVAPSCARYVVYYVNAYGGWDNLLIEGYDKFSESYTKHTRKEEYNNNNIMNRGTENYVTEIAQKWLLHTGYLSDAESLRMHHLLGSTLVYLYDLQTSEMIPVIIANAESEYKTYKNNEHKMPQYTIEATLAQDRERR